MINDRQYKHLMSLSSAEIREFFILYIGLDCFVKKSEIVKLNKQAFLNEIKNNTIQDRFLWEPYSYRLKIIRNDSVSYLLFRNKDRKYCVYNSFDEITFKYLYEYNDSLSDQVIDLLIDACHNNVESEEGYKHLNSLFTLKRLNEFGYRFIVGSGINFGYGMPLWQDLEKDFESVVDHLFGKPICKDISTSVFNTTYGSFQIVKDISYPNYRLILETMIDSAKEPNRTDNSTLTSIAAVLYAQSLLYSDLHQLVLTFNYDDLLERALNDCYSEDSLTIYKNSLATALFPGFSFSIIHTHGFIPKAPELVLKQNYDSIVLTTNEYFENYKSPSSYGYSELYNQLDKVCSFVGNSLTDYEEQKVISRHFNDHPSQFHFCYFSLEKMTIETVIYKTIFLLKIGIIPFWYESHDKYVEEFYNYAETICGHKLR